MCGTMIRPGLFRSMEKLGQGPHVQTLELRRLDYSVQTRVSATGPLMFQGLTDIEATCQNLMHAVTNTRRTSAFVDRPTVDFMHNRDAFLEFHHTWVPKGVREKPIRTQSATLEEREKKSQTLL